jgi:hypothetical protein
MNTNTVNDIDLCCICLDDLDPNNKLTFAAIVLQCGHILHRKCFNTMLHFSIIHQKPLVCPLCRANIVYINVPLNIIMGISFRITQICFLFNLFVTLLVIFISTKVVFYQDKAYPSPISAYTYGYGYLSTI